VSAQKLVWPVGFLSSAYVSPDTMPTWLRAIATGNPASATATGVRDLLSNSTWMSPTWATDHAVLLATLWPALLTLVFLPSACRQWRRLAY
jgi:ABC-2 type transport system permease protein